MDSLGPSDVDRKLSRDESSRIRREIVERIALHDPDRGLSEILRPLTEAIAELLRVERVSVWLMNVEGDELFCEDLFLRSCGTHESGAILRRAEYGPEWEALERSLCVDANDALTDPRTCGYVDGYLRPNGITSMLDTSIRFGGQLLGTLCFEHVQRPHRWTDEEIEFGLLIAGQLSAILERRARAGAERRLAEREAMLSALFDGSPIAIQVYGPDGVSRMLNPAMRDLLGIPSVAYGVGTYNLLTDPHAIGCGLDTLFRTALSGVPVIGRIVDPDYSAGDTPWDCHRKRHLLEVSFFPVHHGTALEAVVVFSRDVSAEHQAREEAERRTRLLQAIIDASPAIIWVKDLKGRFVIVNRQTELMSGFRADQLLGRTSADLFSDEWVDQWWVTDRKVLEEGVSLQLEETAPVGDGVHHILSVKFPLRDETGAVVGLGSIGTDITDQKRGEAEREHLRERLRQSEKLEAIGSLAGGIAHDFNNLLTVISGFAEMARSELAPAAPLRRPLDEILEAAGLGASLTRQLLTFSSRQPIAPEVLGANEAIRSLVAILERLLGAGVRLSCELSPSTCPVLIDRGQFKLILINLAVNARDAMPDGGSLRIRTRIDARDPSRGDPSSSGARPSGGADVASSVPGADVVIEIADTGSGMPPEVRDRVFEPFFTTKEPGKGTGLGLATVYGIVTGAGGSIDCRTELGVGTTFILRLPLAAREPNVGGRREESGTNSAGGRILIVEDNPGVRSLLERMLESAGHRVHSATDGASARRILADRAGGFDLMLTDIVMPGESGASLAAGVQAEYPGLRIGFLSGYPRDVALSDLGRVRGAGFLGKPFTMAEARDFVHRLLSEPMPVAPAVSGGVPSEALPP